MEPHQLAIARLAWARALGLDDDALTTSGVRAANPAPARRILSFLRLGDVCTLIGPAELIETVDDENLEDLADPAALLTLTNDPSARCTGSEVLLFTSDYTESSPHPDDEQPLVSSDPAHSRTLAGLCPPDDVTESALGHRETVFTLLTDDETPIATAGYSEFEGFVADVGVLTAPDQRRKGFASIIGRIATEDALDSGLVPQFRVHRDNFAARALARSLGYSETGIHTSVNVQPHTE
ncbi:MAG: GNAT family N-acetyltransferase [Rhodococcus sp.]|nr:GNAT family N-acetyltransferase [Rhodococcus sp. (in: high G+C Gram-positive bacteria)]